MWSHLWPGFAAEDSPILEELGLESGGYGVLTLHRPSNVDEVDTLRNIIRVLDEIQRDLPLVFPVHPRTRHQLESIGLWDPLARLQRIALRETTERPVTVEMGGNHIAGTDPDRILAKYKRAAAQDGSTFGVPPLWDGRAAERIAKAVVEAGWR